jgi:predicted esterase
MSSAASRTLLRSIVAPLSVLGALAGCGETATTPPPSSQDAAADTGALADTGAAAPVDAPTEADAGVAPTDDVPPMVVDDVPDPAVVEPPMDAGSCDLLASGMVTGFRVDALQRSFLLALPPGATAPGGHWPVVFNWHGLGDSAPNMHPLFSGEVGNAAMPFILVTPVSTMLGPTTSPLGLEWENLRAMTPNREARLFDAVLHCIDQRWGVDRDRVYTAGFSAGAIMSDLLGVLRGSQLAAIASYSGGYFSNEANPATLGPLRTYPSWPALPSSARYAQLLMYGGERDSFNLFVAMAHFDVFAANDVGYLNARRHDVLYCNHNGGHTVPRTLLGRQVVQFFAAHPRGVGPSPWATERPAGWPSYCEFRGRLGG